MAHEPNNHQAAESRERIRIFAEGRNAYNEFEAEIRLRHEDRNVQDYERARSDPRLDFAKARLLDATGLAEKAGRIHDAAVAKIQVGSVCMAREEFSEAESWIKTALNVLESIPVQELYQTRCIGTGRYYLGIAAMKQERWKDAMRELRIARRTGLASENFTEVSFCDSALSKCMELAEKSPDPTAGPHAVDEHWISSGEDTETPEEDEEVKSPARLNAKVLGRHRPLAVLIASYSVEANAAVRRSIGHLEDRCGHPVSIGSVTFGADRPVLRNPPALAEGEHLCAVILVIDKDALQNPGFRDFVMSLTRRMGRSDFRLFSFLEAMSVADLRSYPKVLIAEQHPEAPSVDKVVTALFDSTQVARWSSVDPKSKTPASAAREAALKRMARTLHCYVVELERQRDMDEWRTLLLWIETLCGLVATGIITAAILLTLAGIAAMLLRAPWTQVEPWGAPLASSAVGILAFPINSILLFSLLRGTIFSNWAGSRNALLRWWLLSCILILGGGGHLRQSMGAPNSWFFMGLVAGVVLEVLRRAGYGAERRRTCIKVADAHDEANNLDTASVDAIHNARAGGMVTALKCGLMSGFVRRIFISYTSRSERVSRFATALYRDLRKAGAVPFLDRASIPVGVNWLTELNDQLGRCDACVCILDEHSVHSGWVAAELQAVLKSLRVSGAPEIVILVDPALKNSTDPFPLFRGVLQAASEPQLPGQPTIMWLSAETRASLVWSFCNAGIFSKAIFTKKISAWLAPWVRIVEVVSNLGLLLGWLALAAVWTAVVFKLQLISTLAEAGWRQPLAVMSSYSLGYAVRIFFACRCGHLEHVNFGGGYPGGAALGMLFAMIALVPCLRPLLQCWCIVTVGVGWLAGSRYLKE